MGIKDKNRISVLLLLASRIPGSTQSTASLLTDTTWMRKLHAELRLHGLLIHCSPLHASFPAFILEADTQML